MKIAIAANEADVLNEFYEWLRSDVAVARSADVGLADADPGSGHMGAADVINIVLSNTVALGSLAIAYASWRKSRSEPPEQAPALTFAVNNVTIVVRDADPETIERLTAAAEPESAA